MEEVGTAKANMMAGAQTSLELLKKYEHAPADSDESAQLLERIEHLGGWTLEHRIKSLVEHLHAPALDRAVRDLSGGEKRRVVLCCAPVLQTVPLFFPLPHHPLVT